MLRFYDIPAIIQLWAKQLSPYFYLDVLSTLRLAGEMGVDTLRQSLLLGKPQRTLNKLWMMPQTKDGTNGNKNSNCLNGYFLFPQYVDVFWLFSCPPVSGPHSHVRLTLFQSTFLFASSTYLSLTWDGARVVDWENKKFKTCSLDDYSMGYLSNTVYVLFSRDHGGDDLLVFLSGARFSAMSMIFQSRWLIWLYFFCLFYCWPVLSPEVCLVLFPLHC